MIEALLELSFTEDSKKFDCGTCLEATKKIRKCQENRFDFTAKDNVSVFPIQAVEGGTRFGFCPGKSTWYPDVVGIYRSLTLCAETGNLLYSGTVTEQPDWVIDLLGWFIPRYKEVQWGSRMKQLFGKSKNKASTQPKGKPSGSNHRRITSQNRGGRVGGNKGFQGRKR